MKFKIPYEMWFSQSYFLSVKISKSNCRSFFIMLLFSSTSEIWSFACWVKLFCLPRATFFKIRKAFCSFPPTLFYVQVFIFLNANKNRYFVFITFIYQFTGSCWSRQLSLVSCFLSVLSSWLGHLDFSFIAKMVRNVIPARVYFSQ